MSVLSSVIPMLVTAAAFLAIAVAVKRYADREERLDRERVAAEDRAERARRSGSGPDVET